mmetsp:Transcript_28166/g.80983  ORF Transcript_28166/g.80983 Transcript_28166/m.80983 type:complete len:224 (-) Transcript_28166:20-691(-)
MASSTPRACPDRGIFTTGPQMAPHVRDGRSMVQMLISGCDTSGDGVFDGERSWTCLHVGHAKSSCAAFIHHSSTHDAWNACSQNNFRQRSPGDILSKHTAQRPSSMDCVWGNMRSISTRRFSTFVSSSTISSTRLRRLRICIHTIMPKAERKPTTCIITIHVSIWPPPSTTSTKTQRPTSAANRKVAKEMTRQLCPLPPCPGKRATLRNAQRLSGILLKASEK